MEPVPHEGNIFRYFIGILVICGGLGALAALYFVAIPGGNKDPLLLAIGIVLGWGGSVVSSEYGATTTGRKVADAAVRNIESQTTQALETGGEPKPVKIVSPDPLPVTTEEPKPDTDIDAAPR